MTHLYQLYRFHQQTRSDYQLKLEVDGRWMYRSQWYRMIQSLLKIYWRNIPICPFLQPMTEHLLLRSNIHHLFTFPCNWLSWINCFSYACLYYSKSSLISYSSIEHGDDAVLSGFTVLLITHGPWFARREMEYLDHVRLGHVPRLTRVEWGFKRRYLSLNHSFIYVHTILSHILD